MKWCTMKISKMLILLLFLAPTVTAQTITTYSFAPITDSRIIPNTVLSDSLITNQINVMSCPGEYISATFVVKPTETINAIQVTASDLHNGIYTISSSDIDIKTVKCWYQKGVDLQPPSTSTKLLVPELLLNDDELVEVTYIDDTHGWNNLKTTTGYHPINNVTEGDVNWQVDDATSLQPVTVEAGKNKQFWVTIHVPEGSSSGSYTGEITLSENSIALATIQLNVDVLGFTLSESPIEIGIYNYLRNYPNTPQLDEYWGGTNQLIVAYDSMKKHGITNPVIQQAMWWNQALFEAHMQIRVDTGFPMDKIYYTGFDFGDKKEGRYSTVEEVISRCSNVINFFSTNYGTQASNIYFYPDDEDDLTYEPMPTLIGTCRSLGAKTTCANSGWQAMASLQWQPGPPLLDVAILGGWPLPSVITAYHNANLKIGSYGNPQGGEEKPLTFRKNYGILLWQMNIDYSTTYGIAQGVQLLWNDWNWQPPLTSVQNLKQECMVYPTTNGCIDTVQWEGFREGVNDIRYITKLQQVIIEADQKGIDTTSAENYINQLKGAPLSTLNMDIVRTDVVNFIIILGGEQTPGFEASYMFLAFFFVIVAYIVIGGRKK
jgi:hypothetical protein